MFGGSSSASPGTANAAVRATQNAKRIMRASFDVPSLSPDSELRTRKRSLDRRKRERTPSLDGNPVPPENDHDRVSRVSGLGGGHEGDSNSRVGFRHGAPWGGRPRRSVRER